MIINIEKIEIKLYMNAAHIYFVYPQYKKAYITQYNTMLLINGHNALYSDESNTLWFIDDSKNKIVFNIECSNMILNWCLANTRHTVTTTIAIQN